MTSRMPISRLASKQVAALCLRHGLREPKHRTGEHWEVDEGRPSRMLRRPFVGKPARSGRSRSPPGQVAHESAISTIQK
jgi:hypothetical protein